MTKVKKSNIKLNIDFDKNTTNLIYKSKIIITLDNKNGEVKTLHSLLNEIINKYPEEFLFNSFGEKILEK